MLYLQPSRNPGLLSAQAEYQARILPALAAQLTTETSSCGHPRSRVRPRPALEHVMTDATSARPWPTPAAAGRCSPACPARRSPPPARLPRRHHRRAADHRLVRPRARGWNLAIATGAPGPDVLDVDQHGPAGNGYAAFDGLRRAGLARRRRRLRADPGRRNARLLRRIGPAQRPPARPPPGLPFPRRLRPGPAVAGRRQALPAHPQTRRPTAAWTGPRSPGSWNPSGSRPGTKPRPAPTATWATWPGGSPASPKATATQACTGPPTAPSTPTRPPISAPWPPPPASRPRRQGDHPHPGLRPPNQPEPRQST